MKGYSAKVSNHFVYDVVELFKRKEVIELLKRKQCADGVPQSSNGE